MLVRTLRPLLLEVVMVWFFIVLSLFVDCLILVGLGRTSFSSFFPLVYTGRVEGFLKNVYFFMNPKSRRRQKDGSRKIRFFSSIFLPPFFCPKPGRPSELGHNPFRVEHGWGAIYPG